PHALLDVREKAAYERGHIYRATSLPRRLVEFRLPALVPARATPLVVSDEDGRLAALTLPTLGEIGYTDVRLLAGGLAGWRSEGRRAGRPRPRRGAAPSRPWRRSASRPRTGSPSSRPARSPRVSPGARTRTSTSSTSGRPTSTPRATSPAPSGRPGARRCRRPTSTSRSAPRRSSSSATASHAL